MGVGECMWWESVSLFSLALLKTQNSHQSHIIIQNSHIFKTSHKEERKEMCVCVWVCVFVYGCVCFCPVIPVSLSSTLHPSHIILT